MESSSLNTKIETFIHENTVNKAVDFDEGTDLLESGIVDSLMIVSLVLFLEESFSLSLTDEDFSIENFGSVRALIKLVERKSGGA